MELKKGYTPLYFLASLGLGGLSVSFFIYLNFMINHKGYAMVTFDHIYPMLTSDLNIIAKVLIVVALIGILYFGIFHIKMLLWNVKQYKLFKQTPAFKELKTTQAEVSLMVMPLTFAMTINVCFVFGATFVPNLWSIIEFMFPFALVGFGICGYYALKIFGEYILRVIKDGGFNHENNNNFSQMIAIFSFSMIAVGFAAPGAMSHHVEINAIGLFFAIMFISIAVMLGMMKFILGAKYMMSKGISVEASPTIWIILPIFTIMGITFIRISMGLDHHFGSPSTKGGMFTLTSVFMALEILFGILGYKLLKSLNYFDDYVNGDKKSAVSYALICPGDAFFVFGVFFIHFGLVYSGVVAQYSVIYFLLHLPLVYVQYITMMTVFKLNKKHFKD